MTFIIRKLNYIKTNKIRNMNQIVIHTNITKIITVVLLSKIQKQIQLSLYCVLHNICCLLKSINKCFLFVFSIWVHFTDSTSSMSELVRLSCGSLYSVYLSSTLSMSVLAYWNRRLVLLKMMRAISQSHSTLSSYAFFIRPNFRLVKVTLATTSRRQLQTTVRVSNIGAVHGKINMVINDQRSTLVVFALKNDWRVCFNSVMNNLSIYL